MAQAKSAATRRYLARFFPAMLTYVLVLFGSIWAIRHLHPEGPLLWLVAVAPAAPIIAAIAAMGLYMVEETDEFLRAVLAQSMLWGMGITMALTTVWGFLENAGLLPHPPLYLIFPLFCFSFGVAQPFISRRYR
jgi:uncharacterized YccA/Bax inhibitor family protein